MLQWAPLEQLNFGMIDLLCVLMHEYYQGNVEDQNIGRITHIFDPHVEA